MSSSLGIAAAATVSNSNMANDLVRSGHRTFARFSLGLLAIVAAEFASAQTPPGERELRIYAGLHAAAAHGDVAEIEQLIAEGEKPNIQDGHSRTPLRSCISTKPRVRSSVSVPIPTHSMPNATTSSPSPP